MRLNSTVPLGIGAAVVAIVIVQVAVEMIAAGMIALAAEVAAPVAMVLLNTNL